MKIKALLEKQTETLRLENSTLRQAVPPEKQKYLPQKPEQTPKPPSLKDRIKALLPKIGKILAVVAVLGGIAALIAVEIAIIMPKDDGGDTPQEYLPETIPYASDISGLNACFGGGIAEYGDRLYFTSSTEGQLYYYDVKGDTKRVARASSENLTAIGNSIYYINKGTSTLYKADVQTNDTRAVGRALCTYALIAADGIYCIAAEKGEIRKYASDGLQYEVIAEGYRVKTFDVSGNDLYVLAEGELLLLDAQTGTVSTLKSGVHLSGIVDGRLMASDGRELFILTEVGFESVGIAARDFNGNGEILVCQDPDSLTMIYAYTDGRSKILAADYESGLTVTENYVSYISVDGFRYLIDIATGTRKVLTHQ